MSEPRILRLREWMAQYNVTYRWIAEQLGITDAGVRSMLKRETMPVVRHEQCVSIGVPEELLPTPLDLPSGPQRREPTFAVVHGE